MGEVGWRTAETKQTAWPKKKKKKICHRLIQMRRGGVLFFQKRVFPPGVFKLWKFCRLLGIEPMFFW